MSEAAVQWALRVIRGTTWCARKVKQHKLVQRVRDRTSADILTRMRHTIVEARACAVAMETSDVSVQVHVGIQFCTRAREAMGRFLELQPDELHCCLKVYVPSADQSQDAVATLARSDPLDARPLEKGTENAHLVCNNTVWCALLGRDDSQTRWRRLSCFCCNDLPSHGTRFRCDRESWTEFYQSTLVYPISYSLAPHGQETVHVGFLAFDSPRLNAFLDLPDALTYHADPATYRSLLACHGSFQLGAIFADTLSVGLRRYYERLNSERNHANSDATAPLPDTARNRSAN